MKEQCKILFQIFLTFLKIGPVTFGGGFAMIPLIEKEVVNQKKWLTHEDVTDVFALSQSVPGAIAINASIFIGHRIKGVKGAIAAMLGISLPTFIIVLALGMVYILIQDNPKVEAAFLSIRVSIVALIVYAAIQIGKTALIDKSTIALTVTGFLGLFFIHPFFMIVFGALFGIILTIIKQKLGYKIGMEKKKEKANTETPIDYYIGAGI